MIPRPYAPGAAGLSAVGFVMSKPGPFSAAMDAASASADSFIRRISSSAWLSSMDWAMLSASAMLWSMEASMLSSAARLASIWALEAASAAAVAPERIVAMRKEAKMLLPRRLSELAERYGFSFGRIFIKHNSSNWGSCSARGNINLNLNLVRLPQLLCDHVILHELCHLRHPNHGPEFHALLELLDADNLRRLAGAGEQEGAFLQLQDAIRHSRARFPVQYILQKELKKYPLV